MVDVHKVIRCEVHVQTCLKIRRSVSGELALRGAEIAHANSVDAQFCASLTKERVLNVIPYEIA
jgi:hypothetical protein